MSEAARSLLTLGVISDEQYRRALASDIADKLQAADSAGEALFWMATRGIVTEAEIDRQVDALTQSAGVGEAGVQAEKLTALSAAQEGIAATIRSVNAEYMDALLELGLIDAGQRDAGLDLRPQRVEGVIDSPGRALAVLVNRGVVTEAQFDELKAVADKTAGQAGHRARNEVVAEAARITHEIVGHYVKAMSGGVFRMFGLLMLGAVLLIGLFLLIMR
jgi:hypothetical protein